jgi:allantoate deiminase
MMEKQASVESASGNALTLGHALMSRLDALAAFTEVPGQLTRRYLSPAHVDAMAQVRTWMEAAGMGVRIDAVCNVIGRYEGRTPGAPSVMLGSHIDTVVDAGKYDGNLGVLTAISVVEQLARAGEKLAHAVEVVAFGEEEGVRFPTYMLTSNALAGTLTDAVLQARDAAGLSVADALTIAGGNAEAYRDCARTKSEIAAYLELHIEQGPVLHDKGQAAATVTAIDGAIRLIVTLQGFAGHAGTVPMGFRRDALAAAAEMIVAIERLGASQGDLVATVGRIDARPGAPNVIPGRVEFSIDMRSPSDAVRHRAQRELLALLRDIAVRRRVEIETRIYQEVPATALDPGIIDAVSEAIAATGHAPMRLHSGAGHDAMVMARICPAGMIFLRCKDGISHNPAELITVEDADVAVRVLLAAVRNLDRRLTTEGRA